MKEARRADRSAAMPACILLFVGLRRLSAATTCARLMLRMDWWGAVDGRMTPEVTAGCDLALGM